MNNLSEIKFIPNTRINSLKKSLLNDSLKKYQSVKSNNKRKINPKEKFQIALENLKEGLREMSERYGEKEYFKKRQKGNDKEIRKINNISAEHLSRLNKGNQYLSFSLPKYKDKRNKTQKGKVILNHKINNSHTNNPISLHRSFLKGNDFSNKSARYAVDNTHLKTFSSFREANRPNYKNILAANKSNILLSDFEFNTSTRNRMSINNNNIKSR